MHDPLDDIAIQEMTVREFITKALNDDWNFRKAILFNQADVANITVVFNAKVPVHLARRVLDDLPPTP